MVTVARIHILGHTSFTTGDVFPLAGPGLPIRRGDLAIRSSIRGGTKNGHARRTYLRAINAVEPTTFSLGKLVVPLYRVSVKDSNRNF